LPAARTLDDSESGLSYLDDHLLGKKDGYSLQDIDEML
jgi:hypothetical protein